MTIIEDLPLQEIARFCKRWQIRELAVFGSALREDFNAESDIDIMVTFSGQSEWGLFDHVRMQQELQALLGRRVDLISRRALTYTQNRILYNEILKTAKVIFAEGANIHAER